ncbi:hypothetical protein RB608_08480 [Nocardioides sp. LHD-245]|uniref:hypothetical protein n=1 Tax=Nocardioides sp. LHD-245 TaxID=3051387 RepID=UPI0027E0C69E|nr:hypothetical protein [Nocardioides sp. LHD-245]
MRNSLGKAGLAVALAVGLGLTAVPAEAGDDPASGAGASEPGPMVLPVSLDQAGAYIGWDETGPAQGQTSLPAELQGVALSEVATSRTVTVALTATGRVVAWGQDERMMQVVPAAVAAAKVVDLDATSTNVGVVTADGRVMVWGMSASYGDATDLPAELTSPSGPGQARVVQLALGQFNGYALKDDGTVTAWGNPGGPGFSGQDGMLDVPDGLRATQLAANAGAAYALTTDGTVVGWGATADQPSWALPPATQVPDNVLAISVSAGCGYALLADGSIARWGSVGICTPPDLGGKKAVAVTGGKIDQHFLVQDQDGVLRSSGPAGTLPASLAGESIAQFSHYGAEGNSAAIVTRMLRAERPIITGSAQVGSGSLTGTPGTFSAGPDEVTSQWLVNGQPTGAPVIGDTTSTLSLAGYPAGTTVTYRSTATKAGETSVTSTSAAVTVAAAPTPGKVAPSVSLKITKAPTMKKAGQATVTVQGGAVATGTATVTATGKVLKKGKKKKRTITVTGVIVNGTTTVKIKKIKGAKGKWTVIAAYAGDATHHPATGAPVKVKIKKK